MAEAKTTTTTKTASSAEAPTPLEESTPPEPDKSLAQQEQEARDKASVQAPAAATAKDSGGAGAQKYVQSVIDKEVERGYRGIAVDPTPNHNYTLAGVTDPNVHTPEEFKIQTGTVVFPDVHEDAKK